MKGGWGLAAGALCVGLAGVMIAGVVRVRQPSGGPALEPKASVPDEELLVAAEAAGSAVPMEIQLEETSRRLESDPALDPLRELASILVEEYYASDRVTDIVAAWRDNYRGESRVIFASPDGKRFLTLTAARANCHEVDLVLEDLADPAVGESGRCKRWSEQAAKALEANGLDPRSARRVLREAKVDTAVRILLIYAGWKRTGPGPDDFRRVSWEPAPVYPQAKFGVARRLALDRVMRKLGVGPYTDTPIEVVTALLRW